ncbi:hypothetical protein BDV96DRAFT_256695 [Lophiotrema nucula]|uniref:Mid2 domain-containing protein n=1 Tax=Lophiotrema nucula TaxID=690887 RepID=A0A6A5YNN5_9PLEO|nr:hypothetical protein BDV96DRAFT_256695 [Lophiotrema nucula]
MFVVVFTHLLLISLFAARACAATITALPLHPRQSEDQTLPSDFIGWTLQDGKYASDSCRINSIWTTSGSYGRCCNTADCFIATNCVSTSIMVNAGSSSTCDGSGAQTKCVTGTVFHYIGDQKPVMNFQCWPQWDGGNWSATIATTTADPTSTATSTRSSDASSGSGVSATLASPTSTSTSTSSSSSSSSSTPAPLEGSQQTQSKSKASKAWIAGPVLGGILGAVLFTFLGIFLYKRHLRRLASQPTWLPMENGAKGAGERYAYEAGVGVGVGNGVRGEGKYAGTRTVEAPEGQLYEADTGRPKYGGPPVELGGSEIEEGRR